MFGIAENKSFLSAIGIIDAPQETRALLVAGIEDLIEKKLVIEISNRLTEADAEAFNAISNEDAAYDWLLAHTAARGSSVRPSTTTRTESVGAARTRAGSDREWK